MASYRHLGRIAVMQTIFAYEFRKGVDPGHMLDYCSREFEGKLKDMGFARGLLEGVIRKLPELVEIIRKEAPEWPVERIAPIDRAILEIGVYEIMFSGDVPPVVAINEAVEMAKSYGDTNSAKFVNGVLSTVMHKYVKEQGLESKEQQEEQKENPPL
jgi:transcription antitermination protein NusB